MAMLVGLAFVFGVTLVFGGYSAISKLPQFLERRRLDQRLSELSTTPDAEPGEEGGVVKAVHRGALPMIDRLLGKTTRGSAFGRWLDQSGVKVSVSGVFLIALGSEIGRAHV